MLGIDPKLARLFELLSREPFFCAYRLAQRRREQGQTPEQQAEGLGIDIEHLMFLGLHPVPRDRVDVEAIAWQMALEPRMLAELLGVT
jgi:hypothetical protein